MFDLRWYLSVMQLTDQRSVIFGNEGVSTQVPPPTQTRDEMLFSNALATAPSNILNLQRSVTFPALTPMGAQCLSTTARLTGYPRVFQLRNSLVFRAGPAGLGDYWDVLNLYPTLYPLNHANCSPVTPRWVLLPPPNPGDPPTQPTGHLDGGAVHLITRFLSGAGLPIDPLSAGFVETIYLAGGSHAYEQPANPGPGYTPPCCGCHTGDFLHDEQNDAVERIHNPTPEGDWLPFGPAAEWDLSPPSLLVPRADHTAVVLLDGSILLLGGERMDPVDCVSPGCTCIAVKTPELYKPPEVFGTSASTAWTPMNAHFFEHRYHSTAVLLPTEKVVLVGGQFLGGASNPSDKVVEVFSPPYLHIGPRPIIDHTTLYTSIGVDQAVSYNDPQESQLVFDVALGATESNITRVAVMRPASMTHSFDFNQRYVELQLVGSDGPNQDGVVTLTVNRPPNSNYTPPGWYLLTVVDSLGRPADAKWIRFAP